MKRIIGLAAVATLGCSSEGKNVDQQGSSFAAPAVAPIVRQATPSALRPDSMGFFMRPARKVLELLSPIGTAHADQAPTVDSAIRGLFKDMFPLASGTQGQGKINAALIDLDARVKDVESMFKPAGGEKGESAAMGCLDVAATTHRIDLSGINPALDITVNAQCTQLFGAGPMSQGAAGLVFGKNDDAYSMWLNVNGAGMGFVANVTHASQADKAVDFLSLAHESMRVSAYRVKAQPSTNRFELVCAGGCSAPSAGIGGLDCGFQLISDGNFIFAQGTFAPMGDCSTATAFENCYSASDLSVLSTGCDTLKTELTLAPMTSTELAGAGADFDSALELAKASTP